MTMLAEDIIQVADEYARIREYVPVGPIHTEAEYDKAVEILDKILDIAGENEKSLLAELAETIGVFIEAYDADHYPVPEVTGIGALEFLMEQNGLRQSDLPEIGRQSVVSAVLSGKRRLNLRQVVNLAQRFNVPVDVFAAP